MIDDPLSFRLEKDVALQMRPARLNDAEFEWAVRSLCEVNPGIFACWLVEARSPVYPDPVVLIVLLLDDSAGPIAKAAAPFVEMLAAVPRLQHRTYILEAGGIDGGPPGDPFYVRDAAV